MADGNDLDAFGPFASRGQVARDDDAPEAQPGRFADALFGAGGGAYFARKADFAGTADARADGPVVIGGDDRRDDGQVEPRVGDLEPAREVEKDVLLEHFEPDAFFDDSQQHAHAPGVEPGGGTLGCAVGGTADQRLHLYKIRPHTVGRSSHGNAAQSFFVMGQQDFGRVVDPAQSAVEHLEDTDFVGGAETVLDAAQDAVDVVAVALELEYDVDYVFQYLGSGNGAVLGDVADNEDGRGGRLGVFEQRGGAFADLRHAARRRIEQVGVDGLYGVDDYDVGFLFGDLGHDVFEQRFGVNQTLLVVDA